MVLLACLAMATLGIFTWSRGGWILFACSPLPLLLASRVRPRVSGLDPELERRAKAAAEEQFRRDFPDREPRSSEVWADEGETLVIAVYQRNIRPSTSPTFFRVHRETGVAVLEPDPFRYRPRNLK
jgi:hypothetical protein